MKLILKDIYSLVGMERSASPFPRYFNPYIIIFGILFWANHIVLNYRVLSNVFFFLLPVIGTVTMYLWFVLLADEFLNLIKIRGRLVFFVRTIKALSFIFIILYGIAAAVLLTNGNSFAPVRFTYGKIASMSNMRIGILRYQWADVVLSGQDKSMKKIIFTSADEPSLFVGEAVELVTRTGILGLDRILEVRDDEVSYYLKMLEAVPDAKIAYERLIEELVKRRKFDDALKFYAEYRHKYSDNDDAGHFLGGNLIDAGRFGQAVEVFSRLIETNNEYEVMYLYGYALAWAGRKQDAAVYLIKAAEIDPEDYRAYYSLGYVYRDLGEREKAKRAWSRVLELLPNFPEVSNNLKNLAG